MYVFINIIAVLFGVISVFCLLRQQKVQGKQAVCFAALLFGLILCFGADFNLVAETKLRIGFGAIRGIVGGGAALAIVLKWYPKYFDKVLKATIVSLPLMYSISKFSCMYVGCCHGFVYDGLFAYVHDGDSYFPVQLLEIIVFALIYLLSIAVFLQKKSVYFLPNISLFAKFLLDFCREERNGVLFLSINQIFLLGLAVIWFVYLRNKKRLP